MNKTILLMGILFLSIVSVSASTVSYLNVQVDCGTNSWWNPFANTCQDYELQDEFNQVNTAVDTLQWDNHVNKGRLNDHAKKIWNHWKYLKSNEADYLKDTDTSIPKWTKFGLWEFLTGTGQNMLSFATYTDFIVDLISRNLEQTNRRLDTIEAKVTYGWTDGGMKDQLNVIQIRANRLDKCLTYNDVEVCPQ